MPLTQNSLPSSRLSGDLPLSRRAWFRSARPRAAIPPGAARLRAFHAEAETTSVARDLGATSETASKGARWLASSPHHTRGRYLGIRGRQGRKDRSAPASGPFQDSRVAICPPNSLARPGAGLG